MIVSAQFHIEHVGIRIRHFHRDLVFPVGALDARKIDRGFLYRVHMCTDVCQRVVDRRIIDLARRVARRGSRNPGAILVDLCNLKGECVAVGQSAAFQRLRARKGYAAGLADIVEDWQSGGCVGCNAFGNTRFELVILHCIRGSSVTEIRQRHVDHINTIIVCSILVVSRHLIKPAGELDDSFSLAIHEAGRREVISIIHTRGKGDMAFIVILYPIMKDINAFNRELELACKAGINLAVDPLNCLDLSLSFHRIGVCEVEILISVRDACRQRSVAIIADGHRHIVYGRVHRDAAAVRAGFSHNVEMIADIVQIILDRRVTDLAISVVLESPWGTDGFSIGIAFDDLEAEDIGIGHAAAIDVLCAIEGDAAGGGIRLVDDGQIPCVQGHEGICGVLRQGHRAAVADGERPTAFLTQLIAVGSFGLRQGIGAGHQAGEFVHAGKADGVGRDGIAGAVGQCEFCTGQDVSVMVFLDDAHGERIVGDHFVRIGAGIDNRYVAADSSCQAVQLSVRNDHTGRNEHITPLPGCRVKLVIGGRFGFFHQHNLQDAYFLNNGDDAVCIRGVNRGRAYLLAGRIQRRDGELRAGEHRGRCLVRIAAVNLEDADTDFVILKGEAAALIGGVDVKDDFNRTDRTAFQGGVVHKAHVLRAHGLGGLDLIAQAQGRVVRNIEREALAILGKADGISACRGDVTGGKPCAGGGVEQAEGVRQIDEGFLAAAHDVLQAQGAVFAQGQGVGVHIDGIGHLVAGGGHPLGLLVQHDVLEHNIAAGAGGSVGVAAPGDGGAVGQGHRHAYGRAAGLVQRFLDFAILEHGVVADGNVAADPGAAGTHLHGPVAAGLGEFEGELVGIGIVGEGRVVFRIGQVDHGVAGCIQRCPDMEGSLPSVARDVLELELLGQRIRDGDGNRIGMGLELIGAGAHLPADFLLAVAVVIVIDDILIIDGGTDGLGDSGILAAGGGSGVFIRELHAGYAVVRPCVVGDVPLLGVGGVPFCIVHIAGDADAGEVRSPMRPHQLLDSGHIELDGKAAFAIRAQIIIRMRLFDGEMFTGDQAFVLAVLCVHIDFQRQIGDHAVMIDPDLTWAKGIGAGGSGLVDDDQFGQTVKGDLRGIPDLDEPLGDIVIDEVSPFLGEIQFDALAQLGLFRAADRAHAGAGHAVLILDGPAVGQGAEIHRLLGHEGIIGQLELAGAHLRIGGELARIEGEGFVAVFVLAEADIAGVVLVPQLGDAYGRIAGHIPDIKGGRAVDQQRLSALHGIGDDGFGVGHAPGEIDVPADELAAHAFLVVDDIFAGAVRLNGTALDEGGGRIDGAGDVAGDFVDVFIAVDCVENRLVLDLDKGVRDRIAADLVVSLGGQLLDLLGDLDRHLEIVCAGRQKLAVLCGEDDAAVIAGDGRNDGCIHLRQCGQTADSGFIPEAFAGIGAHQLNGQLIGMHRIADDLVHDGEGRELVAQIGDDIVIDIVIIAAAVDDGVAVLADNALVHLVAVGDVVVPADGGFGGQRRGDAVDLQRIAVFLELHGIDFVVSVQLGAGRLAVHLHGVFERILSLGEHACAADGERIHRAVILGGGSQAGGGAGQHRRADNVAGQRAAAGSNRIHKRQYGAVVVFIGIAGDVHVLIEGEGDGIVNLILPVAVLRCGGFFFQLIAGLKLQREILARSAEDHLAVFRLVQDVQNAGKAQFCRFKHGVGGRCCHPFIVKANADRIILDPPAEQWLAIKLRYIVEVIRIELRRIAALDAGCEVDGHGQIHRTVGLEVLHQLRGFELCHLQLQEDALPVVHGIRQLVSSGVFRQACRDGGIAGQRRLCCLCCGGGHDEAEDHQNRQQHKENSVKRESSMFHINKSFRWQHGQ